MGTGEIESRTRKGIQSLHRAFDILEYVAQHDVVGATQIAATLGLPVSTVSNLSRTMVDRGYLVGRRGQYSVGPAFGAAAGRWRPVVALPQVLGPALAELSERTGHAAVATVLAGLNAQVIVFEQGRGAVTTPPPRGDRHALELPTGTVLVALTRREQWPEFVADWPGSARDDASADHLLLELERVAQERICARTSPDRRGQTAIAVPVWSAGRALACAIGISAPAYLVDDTETDAMVTAVTAAARRISAELGASDIPEVTVPPTWGTTRSA